MLMPQTASQQILVVEDDPAIAEMLTIVLEEEGFTAAHASNGLVALEVLDQAAALPAVVLVDLMMPLMNGLQFHAALGHNQRTAHIPLIILSASSDRQLLQEIDVRQIRFLSKPLDFAALFQMLADLGVQPRLDQSW